MDNAFLQRKSVLLLCIPNATLIIYVAWEFSTSFYVLRLLSARMSDKNGHSLTFISGHVAHWINIEKQKFD